MFGRSGFLSEVRRRFWEQVRAGDWFREAAVQLTDIFNNGVWVG